MPCEKDEEFKCGGNWINSVYEITPTGPLKKAKTGTNIGGWMVLEPWITPSLFYRFLGKTQDEGVGMDSYTVCKTLGPAEGNKLMRAHWDSFYTERDI
jgi:glucan 1,3-beta-glucosidase